MPCSADPACSLHVGHPASCHSSRAALFPCPAGGMPGSEQALDLLPSAGLVTSSEDYYPTGGAHSLRPPLHAPSLAGGAAEADAPPAAAVAACKILC